MSLLNADSPSGREPCPWRQPRHPVAPVLSAKAAAGAWAVTSPAIEGRHPSPRHPVRRRQHDHRPTAPACSTATAAPDRSPARWPRRAACGGGGNLLGLRRHPRRAAQPTDCTGLQFDREQPRRNAPPNGARHPATRSSTSPAARCIPTPSPQPRAAGPGPALDLDFLNRRAPFSAARARAAPATNTTVRHRGKKTLADVAACSSTSAARAPTPSPTATVIYGTGAAASPRRRALLQLHLTGLPAGQRPVPHRKDRRRAGGPALGVSRAHYMAYKNLAHAAPLRMHQEPGHGDHTPPWPAPPSTSI